MNTNSNGDSKIRISSTNNNQIDQPDPNTSVNDSPINKQKNKNDLAFRSPISQLENSNIINNNVKNNLENPLATNLSFESCSKKENNPSGRPKKKTTTAFKNNNSTLYYFSENKIQKLKSNNRNLKNNDKRGDIQILSDQQSSPRGNMNSQTQHYFPFLLEPLEKEKADLYFASEKNKKKNAFDGIKDRTDLNIVKFPVFDSIINDPKSSKSRSRSKSKRKASEINQRLSKKYNDDDFTSTENYLRALESFNENNICGEKINVEHSIISEENSKSIQVSGKCDNFLNVNSDSYLNTINNYEKSIMKAKKNNNYFSEADKNNILSSIKQRKSNLKLKKELNSRITIQEKSPEWSSGNQESNNFKKEIEDAISKAEEKIEVNNILNESNTFSFKDNYDSFCDDKSVNKDKTPIIQNYLTQEELNYQNYFIFRKTLITNFFRTNQNSVLNPITDSEADSIQEEIRRLWYQFVKFYNYEEHFNIDHLSDKYSEEFKNKKTQEQILTYIVETESSIPQFSDEFDFCIDYPMAEILNKLFIKYNINQSDELNLIGYNLQALLILYSEKIWIIYMKILKEVFKVSFKKLVDVFNYALSIEEIDKHIFFDFFIVILTEYPDEEIGDIDSLENFPKEFIELYQENKQLIQETLKKQAGIGNSINFSESIEEMVKEEENCNNNSNNYMDVVDDNNFVVSVVNKNKEEPFEKSVNDLILDPKSKMNIVENNFSDGLKKFSQENNQTIEKAELNFTLEEEEIVKVNGYSIEHEYKMNKGLNNNEGQGNSNPLNYTFRKGIFRETPQNNFAANSYNQSSGKHENSQSYEKKETRKALDDLIDFDLNTRLNKQINDINTNNINNNLNADRINEEKENLNLIDFTLETPIKNTKNNSKKENAREHQENRKSLAALDENLSALKKQMEESDKQMNSLGIQRVEKFFDNEEDMREYLFQVLNEQTEENENEDDQYIKATRRNVILYERTPNYEYSIIPEESNESKFTASKANESCKKEASLGKIKLSLFETIKKNGKTKSKIEMSSENKDQSSNEKIVFNFAEKLLASCCDNIIDNISKKESDGINMEDKMSNLDPNTVKALKDIIKEEMQGLASKLDFNQKFSTEIKLPINHKQFDVIEGIERSNLSKKLYELDESNNIKVNCESKNITPANPSPILCITKSPINKIESKNRSNNKKGNANNNVSSEKNQTGKKNKNLNNISYSSDSNTSSSNIFNYPHSDLEAKNNKSMKKTKKRVLTPVAEWLKSRKSWESKIEPIEFDNFCYEIHPYQRPNTNAYVIDFNFKKEGIWAILLVPMNDEEIKKWKVEYIHVLVQLVEFNHKNTGLALAHLHELAPILREDGYGNINKPEVVKALKQLEEKISKKRMEVLESASQK